jgi:hypothetical protein
MNSGYMDNELPGRREQITCFVELLKNNLPEHRDNRGKRHTLVLVIVGFVSATLVGRQKLSSVHRYICNRADWLYEITQTQKVAPISRAHLPRLLNGLNWLALNELIERCFGVRIQYNSSKKWIAIDGKALRGTLDAGEKQNLILAVDHDTREVVAQARQCGDKSSEIPVVRELLRELLNLKKPQLNIPNSVRPEPRRRVSGVWNANQMGDSVESAHASTSSARTVSTHSN